MKLGKWIFGAAGILLLLAVPAMNTQAFSSPALQNGGCYELALSGGNGLSRDQKQQAALCDMAEADAAWHRQYGNLRDQDIASAVVYEPY